MLSFSPAIDYPVGHNPTALVAADFNSDGKLDLATAGVGIGILLGKSDGSFQSTVIPNSYATSLAVGDFDNDGAIDLATTDGARGRIYLGNGDGSFQALPSIGLGINPTSVSVGDFNDDGKLDLGVTSNTYYSGGWGPYGVYPGFYLGDAAVLLGNGDGSFSAHSLAWRDTGYLSAASLADFNNDGKLDFAVANSDSGYAIVMPGDGTGSFGTPRYSFAAYSIQSMAAGDVNGDGKLDLVTAGQSDIGNVAVLLGAGTGRFSSAQNYTSGHSPRSIALGDLNADGKLDIATTSSIDSTLSVLLGHAGGFRPRGAVRTGPGPHGLVLGDFNRDGRLDAATANHDDNSVSAALNNGIWAAMFLTEHAIAQRAIVDDDSGLGHSLHSGHSRGESNGANVAMSIGAGMEDFLRIRTRKRGQ